MTELTRNTTAEKFAADVIDADRPVLVDFYADWCGPCKMISPTVEALANEMSDRLSVVKVNVDQEQALARQFDVRGIPTLVLFKDGGPVEKAVGVISRNDLTNLVGRHVE